MQHFKIDDLPYGEAYRIFWVCEEKGEHLQVRAAIVSQLTGLSNNRSDYSTTESR